MFAAATGVRAGELWAVRWRHLDLAAKELTVETRVDAYGDEDITKSVAGMRTVPLGDALVRELKEWKLCSGFSKPDDLVFPNAAGNYTSHEFFASRVVSAIRAPGSRACRRSEQTCPSTAVPLAPSSALRRVMLDSSRHPA